MPAFVFPGQGAQYPGMGEEIFIKNVSRQKVPLFIECECKYLCSIQNFTFASVSSNDNCDAANLTQKFDCVLLRATVFGLLSFFINSAVF